MTRIKAHNPAKVVTGGDSSRSLTVGGGSGTIKRCTLYIPPGPGYSEIDFGTDNWHQVTFDGKFELRAGSERLTVAFKKADGQWAQNRDTIHKYDSTAIVGNTISSTTNKDDGHVGDWFNLCYGTDASYNMNSPYAHLKLQLTKMYDGYVMLYSELAYRNVPGNTIIVTSNWELDASAPNQNLRKFIFSGSGPVGMRIGIEGSISVV